MKHTQEFWDLHFMKIAKVVSEPSKDPSTKVGAVIVYDKRIYGTGYNGFPNNDLDLDSEYNNREIKYSKIIHAEDNCIRNSVGIPELSTVYIYPFMPCTNCLGLLIDKKIKRIVTLKAENSRWEKDWENVRGLCFENNIELVEIECSV